MLETHVVNVYECCNTDDSHRVRLDVLYKSIQYYWYDIISTQQSNAT